MRKNKTVTKVVMLVLLQCGFAADSKASCATWNMEGTYTNQIGDRFKIVQPTCATLELIDLQLKNRISLNAEGKSNAISLAGARSLRHHRRRDRHARHCHHGRRHRRRLVGVGQAAGLQQARGAGTRRLCHLAACARFDNRQRFSVGPHR